MLARTPLLSAHVHFASATTSTPHSPSRAGVLEGDGAVDFHGEGGEEEESCGGDG